MSEKPQHTGTPTRIYFIKGSSGDFSHDNRVQDLTSTTTLTSFKDLDFDTLYKSAEQESKQRQHDSSAWAYQMHRGGLSAVLEIHDSANGGKAVAELNMSVLKHYGTWKLMFTEDSNFSGQAVDITPVSVLRKQEMFDFQKDKFMWDMTMGGGRGVLYKLNEGQKEQIGEFAAKTWFKNTCVLVLNTEKVDGLLGMATCVAALNRDI